jgi:hypothetical protein
VPREAIGRRLLLVLEVTDEEDGGDENDQQSNQNEPAIDQFFS